MNLLVAEAEMAGNDGDPCFVKLMEELFFENIKREAQQQEEFHQKMVKKLLAKMDGA